MPDFDDDHPDAEWTGRPQDDPRLLAAQAKGRAEFRRQHPPINCWIDAVSVVELYLNGIVRARVERFESLIAYFDEQGQVVSTVTFLSSENFYDVVEAHLGIERVEEIRDESTEAEDPISSYPREREEREAASFRLNRFRDDEILVYLRWAVGSLKYSANVDGPGKLARTSVLNAITSAVLDDYEASLAHIRAAAETLEKAELAGPLRHCRCASVAVERHIALQNQGLSR